MPRLSDARGAVLRRLYEISTLTDADFGLAIGWSARSVRHTVTREGWRRAPASSAELAARTRRLMEARLERIEAEHAKGNLTAARAAAINNETMKLHATLNAPDRSGASGQTRARDAGELTAALRKIDARIEELARRYALEYAADMVAARIAGDDGAGDAGELAAEPDAPSAADKRAP